MFPKALTDALSRAARPSPSPMRAAAPRMQVPHVQPPKPQGRGIVKALGQKGTTGNFAEIEAQKGKGAAIGALQNKLAKRRGQPIPYKP